MQQDLEEAREMATNRLSELEELERRLIEAARCKESLEQQCRELPDALLCETPQHKALLMQCSMLDKQCVELRSQLQESRAQIPALNEQHALRVQKMEVTLLASLSTYLHYPFLHYSFF